MLDTDKKILIKKSFILGVKEGLEPKEIISYILEGAMGASPHWNKEKAEQAIKDAVFY